MSMYPQFPIKRSAVAVGLALATLPLYAQQAAPAAALPEIRVLGTAEEELRQALGVSTITQEDLASRPPATSPN